MISVKVARWHASACAAVVLLALSTGAQTLYGVSGGASAVVEASGPPGGACAYPNGPFMSGFPTAVAFPCPTAFVGAPPPAILGDIAVDKAADTIWVTDGVLITEYTVAGAALTSFALPLGVAVPGPLTGLGYDTAAGLLWITDGFFANAFPPPAPPGCGVVPAVPVPFALPVAGPATDIEWDPLTGTLFVCDVTGAITNVIPGGAIGPFGVFPAIGAGCPMAPGLQGLAVNTASLGPAAAGPMLYVTDGAMIEHILPGGALAPPTFYTPAPCFPTLAPLNGLAFAAHGLPFGAGADNSGGAAPTIGSIGQSISPSPGFTTTIAGSVPGAVAGLFMSNGGVLGGYLCPAVVVVGLPVYVDPTFGLTLLGVVGIGGGGGAAFATPIPPGVPPGVMVYVQWLADPPGVGLQVTEGLAVTAALP
jgi:hypothetical protein